METLITPSTIEEVLGWKDKETFQSARLKVQYKSPNGRFTLSYNNYINIYDESGYGWNLHVDDSRYITIANCAVEYIEQVTTIMEIYKEY